LTILSPNLKSFTLDKVIGFFMIFRLDVYSSLCPSFFSFLSFLISAGR
jgi:hypothetical protein